MSRKIFSRRSCGTVIVLLASVVGCGEAGGESIALLNPGFNASENVAGNPPLGVNDFTTGVGFGASVPVSVAAGGGSSSSVPAPYTANTLPGWLQGTGNAAVGISNADSSYFSPGGDPGTGPYGYVGAGGSIYEVVPGIQFIPNTAYALGVDVAKDVLTAFPNVSVELRAGGPGGTVVASSNGGPGVFTFVPPVLSTSSHADLAFVTGSTVPAGDLTIVLGASGTGQALFDNVTLSKVSAVPLPSPMYGGAVLLSALGASLVGRRCIAGLRVGG